MSIFQLSPRCSRLLRSAVSVLLLLLVSVERGRAESPAVNPVFDTNQHLIFLNQSGFNLDWPKRFTAPLTPDGTDFIITPQGGSNVLFRGRVQKNLGDFGAFRPADANQLYVVKVAGGALRDGVSDSFYVAPHWMQRIALEPALRFFVDDRSITGTHPGAFGAAPWRDSPYYAYSVESLVHLYLANPSFYEQQRVEMDWKRDLDRALAPGFPYDPDSGEDSLPMLGRIQKEVDGPVGANVPDIVQLIHWGVTWWSYRPVSHDYSGSTTAFHPEKLSQFAFFLYAHPWMEEYFTPKFYAQMSAFAFTNWAALGFFEVDTNIGTFKGREAPGWRILPNLMMHEVAKREGRTNANAFLNAAVRQAEWMVKSLDWNDPHTTKGQRMSEHKTMSGLVALLNNYPDRTPAGLREKIRAWTDVAISRSGNLWDFRRYDNGTNWSLPREMAGHTGGGIAWNEPGNLAGFPSLCWGAASVLGDDDADRARKTRLHELAVAQWDVLFGRNPLGRHSAWRGGLDWLGVERGWPVKYKPICAYLEDVRGTLCSSPATEHFPFNPAGEFRHPEGWTAFNAAFNVALAESVRRETRISLRDAAGKPVDSPAAATSLRVEGPFFVPSITVTVQAGDGKPETLTLNARDNTRISFEGPLKLKSGDAITVEYGHGFFGSRQKFPAK